MRARGLQQKLPRDGGRGAQQSQDPPLEARWVGGSEWESVEDLEGGVAPRPKGEAREAFAHTHLRGEWSGLEHTFIQAGEGAAKAEIVGRRITVTPCRRSEG